MSFKSKDLHFEISQPAFLQRLRGQLAGDDSGRHERPIQRSKRLKKDDEEDAPTYVMEETNDSLTKAEYEAMLASKDKEDEDATQDGEKSKDATTETKKDNIADGGKSTKKRKVAKVIGEEGEKKQDGDEKGKTAEKKAIKKPKKRGKTIKLSFGDEEG
ncbi:hypothetical protein CC80DRAFT_496281 [Byssothecium circinans]|uniref:DUF4604 domain-containing protein n=1 Tax=Byssothecium circinans TaxID=147558 RepID=A0A6A5THQ0_9PLEO|nr:hypothetical protein CC80DRAFT_496281 [Byssothecium circinans]